MNSTFFKSSLIVIVISILINGCQDKSNDMKVPLIDFVIEPSSENCPNGGIKLLRGFDDNFNDILDENEIEEIEFVCNGNDGNDFIQKTIIETKGNNCPNGGLKISKGYDLNSNNLLDENEIVEINFICNGLDGNNALQETYEELPGENCPNGGLKVISGLDLNSNDNLEEIEIISIDFICQDITYLDNEIVINLTPGYGLNNLDSNPNIYQFLLPSFDIRNYKNISTIKMIVFGVKTYSNVGGPDVTADGSFELYDFTNKMVIANSLVKSDDIPKTSYITSSNFINDFPTEEIRLGIKITSNGQYLTQCNGLQLVLIRNCRVGKGEFHP